MITLIGISITEVIFYIAVFMATKKPKYRTLSCQVKFIAHSEEQVKFIAHSSKGENQKKFLEILIASYKL